MGLTKEECNNYSTHCDGNWTLLMQPKAALTFLQPFHIVNSYTVSLTHIHVSELLFSIAILHSATVQHVLVPLAEKLAFDSVKFQSGTFNPFL